MILIFFIACPTVDIWCRKRFLWRVYSNFSLFYRKFKRNALKECWNSKCRLNSGLRGLSTRKWPVAYRLYLNLDLCFRSCTFQGSLFWSYFQSYNTLRIHSGQPLINQEIRSIKIKQKFTQNLNPPWLLYLLALLESAIKVTLKFIFIIFWHFNKI